MLWAMAPESGSRIDTLRQLVEWAPALAHGFSLNIVISLGAVAIGTVAGVLAGAIALSRSFAGRIVRWLIQAFRNAPWLVLIYFTTYVFPFEFTVLGKTLPFPDWLKVTLALALPASANIAEIFRGAIASTPTTQWEPRSRSHSRAVKCSYISCCRNARAACCRRGRTCTRSSRWARRCPRSSAFTI